MINCGINGPESIKELGINAKMNDLQAVMGLCVCVCVCVLDEMEPIGRDRQDVTETCDRYSGSKVQKQRIQSCITCNHDY